MASTIIITILQQPTKFDTIIFKTTENLIETFQVSRTGVGKSAISSQGLEQTIYNLSQAFQVDYNATNLFNVALDYQTSPPKLRITSQTENYFDPEEFLQEGDNGTNFSAVFDNQPTTVDLEVDSAVFIEASSTPCSLINSIVTTNKQIDSYVLNSGSTVNVSTNPFTIPDLDRDSLGRLVVREGADTALFNIKPPSSIVNSQVTLDYVNSPSGATITIAISLAAFGLSFQYSLDNIDFQESNVFSGILAGDYTVYISDGYGCITESEVTIPSFEQGGVGQRFPYSDLPSKSNSIRFAKYVEWGTCSNYKNDENTLSWQLGYTENACEYKQLFQNCDTITTQVKTNYSSIVATVIDEDLVETILDVTKKTNYTDLKDRRDAKAYDIGGEGKQTGIYFLNGQKYDYATGAAYSPPETFNLNGNLPPWGVIGNFVFISGGWFAITNIIYDESVSAYVLIIDLIHVGEQTNVIVSSIYNAEEYNIYEFDTDMSLFQDKNIQINIKQTDDDVSFPEEVYLSEVIEVAEIQEGTALIEYYNTNNTDIFYGTGIKNKIRMPIEYLQGGFSDDVSSERTDVNTYLINSEGYETDLIAFKLMPKQMMRKVVQALAHRFVFINEVQYVKEESPEVSGLIGSNLYRVNAQMTKSNAVYTSRGSDEVFSTDVFEIPALLKDSSNGYAKIKN